MKCYWFDKSDNFTPENRWNARVRSRKEGFMSLLTIVVIVLVLAVVFGGFSFSRRGR